MAARIPITFFAPAKREPIKVVHRQARRLGRASLTRSLLNASLNYLFLLNARGRLSWPARTCWSLCPVRRWTKSSVYVPGRRWVVFTPTNAPVAVARAALPKVRYSASDTKRARGAPGYAGMPPDARHPRSGGLSGAARIGNSLVQDHQHYTLLAVEEISHGRR